jgi:UDP-glucose 4-epimerase
MVRALLEEGERVVVVDDLSAGHADAVSRDAKLVVADVRDRDAVMRAIVGDDVRAVFHFASRIQVGESVAKPRLYYRDNLSAAVELLETVLDAGVKTFILSSTAAVYGDPIKTPIDEDHPTAPVNAYGETKLAIERMLGSYARAYGLRYVALRYFNAAGADADAGLGERHEPESHLLPLAIDAALGRRPALTVYGRDWDTPDGTCVRDYIHVRDLADAHLAALRTLDAGVASGAYNLGTGSGHSVAEVLRVVGEVVGRPVPVIEGPRRDGDPAVLVASSTKAQRAFGWKPKRSTLDRMVRDAVRFHQTSAHAVAGAAERRTHAHAAQEREPHV